MSPHISSTAEITPLKGQNGMEITEKTSLQNLQTLVSYTCEVLGLWKILCDDHQLDVIISFLDEHKKEQLECMSFRDLIVDGSDLCNAFASALMKYYLEDNASINAVNCKLREACPSIYKAEDFIAAQAVKIIVGSSEITSNELKAEALMKALTLCKKICPNLDISGICSKFQQFDFYYGIIDLCLSSARKIDPQDLVQYYCKNGECLDDEHIKVMLSQRKSLYTIIIDYMRDLKTQINAESDEADTDKEDISNLSDESPSEEEKKLTLMMKVKKYLLKLKDKFSKVTGLVKSLVKSPDISNPFDGSSPEPEKRLSLKEAKKYYELMLEMAVKSDDELFHNTLYDWLMETHQIHAMLSIESPFLIRYLEKQTSLNINGIEHCDLLWKLYEKKNDFSMASKILKNVADDSCLNLSLSQRIEYFCRAVTCLRSSDVQPSDSSKGEILTELEEKIEVGRIQLNILQILRARSYPDIQDSIAKLDSSIMTLTELYENYAVKYDLPEIMLSIVYCADYYFPSLIEKLWKNIINKEFAASFGNLQEVRIQLLQNKIYSLSQLYMKSRKYFPVATIIKYLELKSRILNFNFNWVYRTMLHIGLSLDEILDAYHKIYCSKENCWLTTKNPFHLLCVISHILTEYTKDVSILSQNKRKCFEQKCLNFVTVYLVDLRAVNVIDSHVFSLLEVFEAIQDNLKKSSL